MVVDPSALENAQRQLREALFQYERAQEAAEFTLAIFALHTALESAYKAHLTPQQQDTIDTFSQRAQHVTPNLFRRFDVRRLNQRRNQFAHPSQPPRAEEVKQTADGFADYSLAAWHVLFGPDAQKPDITKPWLLIAHGHEPVQVETTPERPTRSEPVARPVYPPPAPEPAPVTPQPRRGGFGALIAFFVWLLLMPVAIGYALGAASLAPWALWVALAVAILAGCGAVLSSLRVARGFGPGGALVLLLLGLGAFVWLRTTEQTSVLRDGGTMLIQVGGELAEAVHGPAGSTTPRRIISVQIDPATRIKLESVVTEADEANRVPSPTEVESSVSSPDATATPRPSGRPLAIGTEVTVVTEGGRLRLRDEPSLSGAVVDFISDGTALTIIDGPQTADGFEWWRVTNGEIEGWGAGEFLRR